MKFNIRIVIFGVIILTLILLVLRLNKLKADLSVKDSLLIAITDSVTVTKNKLGESVSTIHYLQTTNFNLLKEILSKDVYNKELLNNIQYYKKQNKYLESLVIFYSGTHVDSITPTIVDSVNSYPVYKFDFNDKWVKLSGVATKDTTFFNIDVFNEYSVASIKEKDGILLEITNKNPYTVSPVVRGWKQPFPQQKKFGIGFSVGYGLSKGGFYPYIGIGFNYNLISF